jgi:hypothetical protein
VQNPYYDGTAADRERKQSLVDEERTERFNEWWSAAKGWVGEAGEKLVEAEKEVWKWASGK